MDLKQVIADWIRQAREHAGLSQEGLGGRLAIEFDSERGYTKANISHWETQKHEPSIQQLLAIKKITNHPLPDELLSALGGKVNGGRGMAANSDDAEAEDFVKLVNGFWAASASERKVILSAAEAALENAMLRDSRTASDKN